MSLKIEEKVIALIPHDKALHALAGATVFAAMHPFGVWVAMLAVLVTGIAKEAVDHLTGRDVSVWDVVATIGGGVLGALCSL